MTEKRRRRRAREAGRIWAGREGAAANEVWTVDFKGWWRSWGKRCEPLTVRDEHSRYVLELRALEDARTETVRRSFERLFERHGLPQAIRSDNGAPFASAQGLFGLSRLSVWWVALGIDLQRGRPGHPHERPHESLGMKCPGELYRASERKYEGTPEDLEYQQMCSRRVRTGGTIKLDGQSIFLSGALAGWSVGLKPMAQDRLEVWFGRLLLGEIDLAASNFIRAQARAPEQTAAPPSSCG